MDDYGRPDRQRFLRPAPRYGLAAILAIVCLAFLAMGLMAGLALSN